MVDFVFLLFIGIYKVGIQDALKAGWACNLVPGKAEKRDPGNKVGWT